MGFWETYLWGGLGILGMVSLLWLISLPLRNASIVDIFWGLGFVFSNAFYFWLADGLPARKWLMLVLVSLWGLRLAGYLGWRNIGKGEDFRYQKFRKDYGPTRYWWISYFQVFLLQGVLMWLISIPIAAAQIGPIAQFGARQSMGASLNVLDYVGIGFWAIGLFFEAVGDWQLSRFKAQPANKGKVMDRGLWRYTRHPNYFGDAMVWWGFGLIGLATGNYWSLLGSLLMTGLIIKVSGVALLEKSLKTTKPEYASYIRRTSAFIPWPPKAKP